MDDHRDRTTSSSATMKTFDLDALLHPAEAFSHPREVVGDPDLTLNEKRAILASWASDACSVEAMPALRLRPDSRDPVLFDEIMEALQELDRQAMRYETSRTRGLFRRGVRGRPLPGAGGMGFYS